MCALVTGVQTCALPIFKVCFTYSMNAQDSPAGKAPPLGDQIYTDLQTYFHWLAKGAPTDTKLKGAGFIKLKETKLGYDPGRGAQVFQQNCAAGHGADGQGQRDINGRVVFPPLWGPHSYNWGAGMASVKNAAAFVKKNMPLGQTDRLTDQQAWDVAAYIDSRERPKDPRQTGTIAETAKKNHGGKDYYGKTVNGHLLGTGTPNSGRSEEHTSELQSLMRISYAVFCMKKNNTSKNNVRKQPQHIQI